MADAAPSKSGGCLKTIGFAVLLFLVLITVLVIIGPSDGEKTSAGTPAPEAAAIEVDAVELAKAYDRNEVAAQKQYGDSPLVVTGVIHEISLDFANNPVVSFEGAEMFQNPQASFSKADADAVSQLNKGQVISVRCQRVSEVIGTPMLSDCKLR